MSSASVMARRRASTKSLRVSWVDAALPVSVRSTQGPACVSTDEVEAPRLEGWFAQR